MSNTYLHKTINLSRKQISTFVNDIISANAAQVVLPIKIKGTIKSISGATSRIPAAGPVTYTVHRIRNGASAPITGAVISIPTVGVIAGQSVTVDVVKDIEPGDTLVVVVGGTNTGAGTGAVSFLIT